MGNSLIPSVQFIVAPVENDKTPLTHPFLHKKTEGPMTLIYSRSNECKKVFDNRGGVNGFSIQLLNYLFPPDRLHSTLGGSGSPRARNALRKCILATFDKASSPP